MSKEEDKHKTPEDPTVDSVVQRATERLFASGPIKLLRWILIVTAGLLVGGLGFSAYQVWSIKDRAGQAKEEIKLETQEVSKAAEEARGVIKKIDDIEKEARGKIEPAATRITLLAGTTEGKIAKAQEELLKKLNSAEVKELTQIRAEVATLTDQLGQLEERLRKIVEDADASLTFVRLSREIDGLKSEMKILREPPNLGLAVTSNIGWVVVFAPLVLAVGLGFILGRFFR